MTKNFKNNFDQWWNDGENKFKKLIFLFTSWWDEYVGGVMQGLVGYKAMVQSGKTVLSPATQTRNFGSASLFPLLNGWIGGNASVRDAFKIVMDDIFGAGRTVNEEALIKNIGRKITVCSSKLETYSKSASHPSPSLLLVTTNS